MQVFQTKQSATPFSYQSGLYIRLPFLRGSIVALKTDITFLSCPIILKLRKLLLLEFLHLHLTDPKRIRFCFFVVEAYPFFNYWETYTNSHVESSSKLCAVVKEFTQNASLSYKTERHFIRITEWIVYQLTLNTRLKVHNLQN